MVLGIPEGWQTVEVVEMGKGEYRAALGCVVGSVDGTQRRSVGSADHAR